MIKEIEKRISKYKPSIIITHHFGDLNIDHKIVNEATIVASRSTPGKSIRELLFFEVPSSTEWQSNSNNSFIPNYFINISDTIKTKLEAMHAYNNELREFPHPRSTKAIEALATWRGATVGVEAAEAFILGRKIL